MLAFLCQILALLAQAPKTMSNFKPVRFRVRHIPSRRTSPWCLDFTAHGRRIRRFFLAEEMAWAEGQKLSKQVQERGTRSLDAVEDLSVASALRLFMAGTDAVSKSHQDKLKAFDARFGRSFHGAISAVTPSAIEKWIKSQSKSPTTQAMYFRYARMFFRWLRANRLIDDNPIEGVRAPRATSAKNILTPEQMTKLLEAEMPDYLRALILLGGFAGLRTEEVARMTWEKVNVTTGQIHVPPDAIKRAVGGMDQRIVDFTEPLTRRVEFFKGKTGQIIPSALVTLHTHRRALAKTVFGWEEWPDNCLRHSFATYHLARCKSAPLTAFQMGHTNPGMVQKVYAVPAALADWQAWWAI
jgi:integrase